MGGEGTAPGDQRTLGRKLYQRGGGRGGFSPGGFSDQGDEAAWLKYLAEVGRTGSGYPRSVGRSGGRGNGFAGVTRQRS